MENVNENVLRQKSLKAASLLVICLLFGVWLREAIMGGEFGLSVLMTVVIYYCVVLWYFDFNFAGMNKKAMLLSFPIVFLATGFFFHDNFASQIFAIPTLFGLIIFQTLFLFDQGSRNFISLRYFPMVFRKTVVGSVNGLVCLISQIKLSKNKRISSEAKNVILGLLIALPVVLILITLFSSADSGYAEGLKKLFDYFNLKFNNIFLDIFFAVFFGFPIAACLVGLKHAPEKPPITLEKPIYLNITILSTVLISLLMVALSFIIFQSQELFSGPGGSLVTRASSAIEGFIQLTFASAVLFSAITPVFLLAKKNARKLPNILRALVLCLSLSNLIILYSAFLRMSAYIEDGGLSIKRLLTMWFMVLIAVSLIGLIVKCFVPRLGLLQFLAITALVGVCFLNIINVDRSVAQFNIGKYIEANGTYTIDVKQLGSLNSSILPDLRKLDANMPESKAKADVQRLMRKFELENQDARKQTIFNFNLNW